MAAKKTGADAPEGSGQKPEDGGPRSEDGAPGGGTTKDQPKPDEVAKPDGAAPKGEGVEAVAGELKRCDLRPTAEEMFGRFMVAVAGRPLSVHQPVNEIGDTAERLTAERLTAEWLARKDKFAAK